MGLDPIYIQFIEIKTIVHSLTNFYTMHTFFSYCIKGLKISALVLPPATLVLLLLALFSPSTLPQWLSIGSVTIDIRVLYALSQFLTLSVAMITANRKARMMFLAVATVLMLVAIPTDAPFAVIIPVVLLFALYVIRCFLKTTLSDAS